MSFEALQIVMFDRIAVIVKKEFLVTLREPKMRVLLFLPPVLQLILFGYAVNLDVEHNRLGWLDRDRSAESRELLSRFTGSTYFDVTHYPPDIDDCSELLDRGLVDAVVHIPAGFSRDLRRGKTARLQVLIDGTNSNTAAIVSNYVSSVVTRFSGQVLIDRQRLVLVAGGNGNRTGGGIPSIRLKERVWFNPELESRAYFIPGVVVNIIALVTLTLTSMAIVREKEIGTMEQLMVTPIRPEELMIGKTLPFAMIGLVQMGFITGAALLVFKVPFTGSGWLLIGCAMLFLLTTLGSGLLISTVSGTQQQAMFGSFFFFLPTFMLSGFTFPIRNMPYPVQIATYFNPIRYFMEIVRGIFLKGSDFSVLWPQMLALLLIGTAVIGFSAVRFKKRLD